MVWLLLERNNRRNYISMPRAPYNAQTLAALFQRQKVATLSEMKQTLGTSGHMTVFRKLKELGYRTSYSHRGRYYTLETVPRFDAQGLWSEAGIWFSKCGTLKATAQTLVTQSESGYFTRELDRILHVSTKKTLQQLVQQQQLSRQRVSGWYLYCAAAATGGKQQLRARKLLEFELILGHGLPGIALPAEELKAATLLVYSLLDEKQRRLWAGLQSLRLGYGGDRKVADLLALDVHTVARGRKQLLQADLEPDRIRQPGAGRKPTKKNSTSDA